MAAEDPDTAPVSVERLLTSIRHLTCEAEPTEESPLLSINSGITHERRAICGHRDRVLWPADCLLPDAGSEVVLVAWDRSVHGQRLSYFLEPLSASRCVLSAHLRDACRQHA